ncbi:MAG: LysR substrate-binding domain-containing protein [Pseudomonadota bacterium]
MNVLHAVSLKQIRYFVVVAEVRSFRKAAAILHMSQPPLTHHIKLLEQTLGVELFDRSARKIELTFAGQELLASARASLTSLTTSLEQARAIGRGLQGSIRIGLTNDYIHSPIFSRISEFSAVHQELPVEMHVNISTLLAEQLRMNMLDIALSVHSQIPPEGDFTEISLPASRIMAVIPDAHPLSSEAFISIKSLDKEALIMFPDESALPIAVECRRLINDGDITPRASHITTNSTLALQLATQGRGIAFASEYSIPKDVDGVTIIPFKENAQLDHVLLHSGKHLSPALSKLIEALVS